MAPHVPVQEGGVSGFLHAFIAEVFAMVRAHVAALGGNAVVSYIMKQCVFMENPNKNQVRCSGKLDLRNPVTP
jgi:hypothetical protein